MEKVKRNLVIIGVIGLTFLLVYGINLGMAEDLKYPTKPINYYIGFGAGGSTDSASRAFIGAANKHLEQPLVAINKAGAGGSHAAMAIINAKPDGYTLGTLGTSTAFMAPFSEGSLFKDLSGLTMIMNFGAFATPLVVRGDAPWKTWKEFIEWAKKNPRVAKIGIHGAKSGSAPGHTLWRIEKPEQVDFTYIPFKSSAETNMALVGGHITMTVAPGDPTIIPYLETGKIRILIYLTKMKIPGYENFPSFKEIYGFSMQDILGVVGPKGLSGYVLKKLNDAFDKAIRDPEFISSMKRIGLTVSYMNGDEMTDHAEKTFRETADYVKELRAQEAQKKQ